MSQHFDRALVLFEQSRPDLAQAELRRALAEDPDHAPAHALLSLCLTDAEQFEEATREAQTAVFQAPDLALSHYALAYAMQHRNRYREARAAIDEAIRLDPYDVDCFAVLAAIEFEQRNWQAALEAAEHGLQINPQNGPCSNLRAMALVKLGRTSEANATIDATLARDPESAFTHSNMGWTCLHTGATGKALEHFKEALRLEPGLEPARAGMIEALKARNFIYRWLLGYFLWMSRLSRKGQWAVILGGYFGYRMLRNVARQSPELAPYLYPILGAYVIFALLTWIGDPLFNTFLRFSRFGRLALSREQTIASNVFVGCVVAIAAAVLLYAVTGQGMAFVAALFMLVLLIPVNGTLKQPAGWPRRVLAAYTLLLAAAGVAGLILLFTHTAGETPHPALTACLAFFLLGSVTFGFVANALGMVRVRR